MKTVYTLEKIQYLKTNYGKISNKDIMKYLNVSYSSLLDKAVQLGLTKKNLNNRSNKLTRICTVCKVEYPKTKEYFTTFISSRDGEVFQTKCKHCEKIYVQQKNSQTNIYLKSLINGIKKDKRRLDKGYDLEYEFIIDLYNKQNGKCALTGIPMTTYKGKGLYFSNVSIDRIDPSKGYFQNNVQLVCFWANQSKGTLSMDEFKKMILTTYKYMVNEN